MPHMSGRELCRAIRDDPAVAHIPIVLVTRLTEPKDILSGLSSGADSYICKPARRAPLVEEVTLLLSGDKRTTTQVSDESRTVWLGDLRFIVRPEMAELDLEELMRVARGSVIAEANASEAERRLQAFFDASPVGMAVFDGQLHYLHVNEPLAKINGRPVEDHIGKSMYDVVPDVAPILVPMFEEVLATGEPILGAEITGQVPSEPGAERHWIHSEFRIPGQVPGTWGLGVVVVEITERKKAEEHQELMVQELDHRVKNTLAAMLGVIEVTAEKAGSTESFVETVTSRVHAMAHVHEALAREQHDIDVRDVVEGAIGGVAQVQGDLVSVAGAAWGVSSSISMPLGQALHELAMNAVKHGSLSESDGRLDVDWEIEDDGALLLRWTESGGSRVPQDPDPGVGLFLVTNLIEHGVGGTVSLDFPSAGARHELRIPRPREP